MKKNLLFIIVCIGILCLVYPQENSIVTKTIAGGFSERSYSEYIPESERFSVHKRYYGSADEIQYFETANGSHYSYRQSDFGILLKYLFSD